MITLFLIIWCNVQLPPAEKHGLRLEWVLLPSAEPELTFTSVWMLILLNN